MSHDHLYAPSGPIYSTSMLGTATYKILTGDLDPDELAATIERCHWCKVVVGRCYSGRPGVLTPRRRAAAEQGLRPLERQPAVPRAMPQPRFPGITPSRPDWTPLGTSVPDGTGRAVDRATEPKRRRIGISPAG